MKMRNVLAFLMVAAMCMAILTACSSAPEASPSESSNAAESTTEATDKDSSSGGSSSGGSSSGGSVYWLNFKPESDTALLSVAAMYKEETGVDVKVITAASGTYEQTLGSEMDKSDPPTLFVIGSEDGVKNWGSYAMDLTGTPIAEQLNTDDYNMYDADGKLVSIGYCYETFGIIVNPTLLEQAGHKVDDIKDFESLQAVVEDIHERKDELGFSAFTSNDMDASSSWRYTGHLANLEYYYEQGGDKWTTCPPTITGDYLDNYRKLYDLAINNSTVSSNELATGGHDAENEFITGKAAFFIQGSWEWPTVSELVPDAVMIPYYCGVDGEEKAGLNNGTQNCWAINDKASEEDKQATMDFMVWCVTNPEASAILVDTFGVMPYKEAVPSSNGFLANAEKYSADGNYTMNWAFNFQPNVDEYRNALVSALNQYDADQSDANWETFKTAFVQGWAQQYQAMNG